MTGKRTHLLSWVILGMAVAAGAIDAFLRQQDGLGLEIPARWVAVLGAVLAALQAGLRNVTTGRAADPRSWGSASWLGLLMAGLLMILGLQPPTMPQQAPAADVVTAPDVADAPVEVQEAPGAPGGPEEASDTGADAIEPPGPILGLVGGILGLGCSGPQRAAMRDIGQDLALCVARCGLDAARVAIDQTASGYRISGEGLVWGAVPCLLPCVSRAGSAALRVYSGGTAPLYGSADRVAAPDRLVIEVTR